MRIKEVTQVKDKISHMAIELKVRGFKIGEPVEVTVTNVGYIVMGYRLKCDDGLEGGIICDKDGEMQCTLAFAFCPLKEHERTSTITSLCLEEE